GRRPYAQCCLIKATRKGQIFFFYRQDFTHVPTIIESLKLFKFFLLKSLLYFLKGICRVCAFLLSCHRRD
ncbi:hypothetical protein, partial [Massilia genomosp. 1]|uniref:hypothetical protein n=1 Tax=Massilia genomosp. 1 TaxID=2609280 RepID=UPI001C9E29FB